MLKAFAIIALALLACSSLPAAEFSLKYNDDSSIYGPFELLDGGSVELDGNKFTITDLDRYGRGEFILRKDDGTSYGPFTLRANSRISIGKASFTMLVVDRRERHINVDVVNATKGKLDSNRLVKFEETLDRAESEFSTAVRNRDRSVGTSDYEKVLTEFKIAARALQEEIVKEGMGGDYDLTKAAMAMLYSYEDAKTQYHGYEEFVPTILSTRRNNRMPGGQPTTPPAASKEDAYIGQNYSDCRVMFDMETYYLMAYRGYMNAFRGARKTKGSQENLHNSAADFVHAVERIRQMIMKLDSAGKWNTIQRNGQTYYMKSPADALK